MRHGPYMAAILALTLAGPVGAQRAALPGAGRPAGHPSKPKRTFAHRPDEGKRPKPTVNYEKQRNLFSEANRQAAKVLRSGPWSKHARDFERSVDSIWGRSGFDTETDGFIKDLMVKVMNLPPWDFNGRLKLAEHLLKQRYNLDPQQLRKIRLRVIQGSFKFFLENAERLLPVSGEMIDTRLSGKPFTPEQIAKWSKVMRPVFEKWMNDAKRDVSDFAAKHLTPEQRKLVEADMAVLDKRMQQIAADMRTTWETGKWTPADWGLEKDPVHAALQRRLARGQGDADAGEPGEEATDAMDPAAMLATSPKTGSPSGPMRLGETPGSNRFLDAGKGAFVPSEDKWAAYVNQFCQRYGLDKAQRAAARAVLKDLRDQARSYRRSHSEELSRLEREIERAESAEARQAARAELTEALRAIEMLFEELKARLDNIPTQQQMRRAG